MRLTWDSLVLETDLLLHTKEKGNDSKFFITKWYQNFKPIQIDVGFNLEHFIWINKESKEIGNPYDEDDLIDPNPDTIDDVFISSFMDEKIYLEYQLLSGTVNYWCKKICIDCDLNQNDLINFCLNLKYKEIFTKEVIENYYRDFGETDHNNINRFGEYYLFTDSQIDIINFSLQT